MKKAACILFIALMGSIMVLPVSAFEVYPLDDLEPGMRGQGLTVIKGYNVETFFVEIIDVIPQSPPTPPLIMVRATGDVIERSGGIASGMSGSPIYVDDKLLGAIGYGYAKTDHRVGLVTPAEPMVELLDRLPDHHLSVDAVSLPDGFRPLETPLMLSGISGRAKKLLESRLDHLDLAIMAGLSGDARNDEAPPLTAGSAFGVQLLRGDFQATSFGTVTLIDGHRFVGFGHPFIHKGNVGMFVTPARVHYTMENMEFPFKIASAGQTVGSLLEDRAAGIAGVLDREPPFLPVDMRITDLEGDTHKQYSVESVVEPSLMESLIISSAYQAIDATLDRVGSGTAYVRIEFHADEFANRVIRDNMHFSDSDIAVWTLVDLMEGMELFIHNALQEVNLSQIEVDIDIERDRRTAAIEKATPRQFDVEAGDSVEVEVQIRPYREEVQTRILTMEVPDDTLPGTMTVTARAGGSDYYFGKPSVHTTFQDIENGDQPMRDVPTGIESLDMLIEHYMNRERNNEIVVEFFPFLDSFPVAEEPEAEEAPPPDIVPDEEPPLDEGENDVPDAGEEEGYHWQWGETSHEPIRVRLDTSYVMEGMASFDLEVQDQP